MAIIYSYPTGTPTASDNLIGTQVDPVTEENKTVQFSIGNINSLATQGYLETTVTLTTAQLTALQGTSVELIATPGVNKAIKVLALSVFLDYTAPAFTFASDILVSVKTAGTTLGTVPLAIGQAAVDTVYSVAPAAAILTTDRAVELTTAGAVGGGGGSSMQVKVRYQVLDITSF